MQLYFLFFVSSISQHIVDAELRHRTLPPLYHLSCSLPQIATIMGFMFIISMVFFIHTYPQQYCLVLQIFYTDDIMPFAFFGNFLFTQHVPETHPHQWR